MNVVRISSKRRRLRVRHRPRSRRGRGSFAKPYLDAINIKTGKKTRIFEGKGDWLETIDAVDGDDIKRVFTTRQKSNVVPDCYMTELATGQDTKLTNNVDRTPWFHELKIERFRVTRVDGFKFWVKVTTAAEGEGQAAGALLDLPARVRGPGRLRRGGRPRRARRRGGGAAAAGGSPRPAPRSDGDPHARSATRWSSRTCPSSARPGG